MVPASCSFQNGIRLAGDRPASGYAEYEQQTIRQDQLDNLRASAYQQAQLLT